MYYIGIDLGGTNIVAGVVDDSYKIIAKARVKTNLPRPAEEIVDDMALVAKQATEEAGLKLSDIEWIGVGSPGLVNKYKGTVEYSCNLGFNNTDLAGMIKERLGIDCYVENDANAAAYGEMLAGAGKGTSSFVAITLGTGVGGGVIMDGKMLNGYNCAGGELGHIVINVDGEPCGCGRNGCWEAYASATACIRQTKRAMEEHKDSKMWELVGGNIDEVSGRTAWDAMRMGDKYGKEVVDRYVYYIAVGVANIINIIRPEVLCIGGGICNEKEYLMKPLREHVENETYGTDKNNYTKVVVAELGGDAGLIGAALLGNLK